MAERIMQGLTSALLLVTTVYWVMRVRSLRGEINRLRWCLRVVAMDVEDTNPGLAAAAKLWADPTPTQEQNR